jgi:Glycosyl transferase family 2
MPSPSISAVIPTLNAAETLELALRSLRSQRIDGELEILIADGGSTDATRELAAHYGAQVVENEKRLPQYGYARGVEAAQTELLLIMDADEELPHDAWLELHVRALGLADDVVAADCLFHTWRRDDVALNRLLALIGGSDPVAIDLGWHDRWATHHNRWTGMLVEQEEVGDVLLVRIDPKHTPPMGSNGFLVRREEVLKTDWDPYYHPDVVHDLAAMGWRFARTRDSIIHHFAPSTLEGMRKARARARWTMLDFPERKAHPTRSPLRLIAVTLWSLTLVGPCWQAIRGFRRHPDPAWALYPLLHVTWTTAYAIQAVRHLVRYGRLGRPDE